MPFASTNIAALPDRLEPAAGDAPARGDYSPVAAELQRRGLVRLDEVPLPLWRDLHARALEPNVYYDPAWVLSLFRHAFGGAAVSALLAGDRGAAPRLTALIPVQWAWQALRLPVPVLVAWRAYASLTVPPLDEGDPEGAAVALLDAAQASGARALLLPQVAVSGAAFAAISAALSRRGIAPKILRSYRRAGLDAGGEGDAVIRAALGAKKLKELRRQRNRLSDAGPVSVDVASAPADVADALERFLLLEVAGWKGRRGTSLGQDAGHAAFIRAASAALAAEGRFEIVEIVRNGVVLASGLIVRHRDRAFFFKLAIDEGEAKASPGVQLTLEVTRRLCSDPRVRFADSSADSEHPMIDRIWRERISIADVLVPLRTGDPLVPFIHGILSLRATAIASLRPVVHLIRRWKEKL